MGWKRILLQKRPTVGGEARKRASFVKICENPIDFYLQKFRNYALIKG